MKVAPGTMHDLLEKDGFNNHASVVVERLAYLEVGWVAFVGMKAMIRENFRMFFKHGNQRMKGRAVHISCVAIPVDYLTEMVEQKAQLATYDTAPIGIALPDNLLLGSSFADRVDQIN